MSKSDLVVLGFLMIKPMYGYEIIQFIKHRELDIWAGIKMPSIYKALHRLEQKNLISGVQEIDGNNPPRTVYSLTPQGGDYFRKVLNFFLKSRDSSSQDFWLAISFLNRGIDRKSFLKIVQNKISRLENHIDCHQQGLLQFQKEKRKNYIPFYIDILMEVGGKIHQIELEGMKKLYRQAASGDFDEDFLQEMEEN
ncbi:MAG: PadR family transcriptional regulator [Candidatus Cloacimonetes bacterium]|nr:PadR family transcriptional regulator [Candidatus Cloacimonadota bacterium]